MKKMSMNSYEITKEPASVSLRQTLFLISDLYLMRKHAYYRIEFYVKIYKNPLGNR